MPGSLQWIFFETTRRPYCEAEVDHLLFHSCIQAMIPPCIWMREGKSLLSFCILRPTPNNEMTVFAPPTRQTGLNEPTPEILFVLCSTYILLPTLNRLVLF